MRILIQRVKQAKVEVAGELIGAIGPGVLVFLGVTHTDTLKQAIYLAQKLIHLRIFPDEKGKKNHSLLETQGAVLIVSQFTLYADCSEGRRPSFTQAAPGEQAHVLYQGFIEEVRKAELYVETGKFGALMEVSLINEGPSTFLLESN